MNLSLATVGRAKKPQPLEESAHSECERASEPQVVNTDANTSTYDGDMLSKSPRDSPREHSACRRHLVDTVGPGGQCMQNMKSKPRNNTSSGVGSSAAPQSEYRSTGAATEHRHLSATQSRYTATDGAGSRSIKTTANVCDVPR